MSSKTSLRQEFSSVSKIERKSDEARSTYKHAGLKVRSDDAVPTFTQKLQVSLIVLYVLMIVNNDISKCSNTKIP